MISYRRVMLLCLCVGVLGLAGLARAGDEFNQSWQALPTGPTSTTYLSGSGARIEVFQTGPNTSYVINTDRDGHQITGTIFNSTPTYEAPPSLPIWRPPVDTLLQDPLADPLGLVTPDH